MNRINKKFKNELYFLLVQMRDEVVNNKLTKKEFVAMIDELIEMKKD